MSRSITTLGDLGRLAAALVEAEREADDVERRLKAIKEHARVLREESVPMAMLELELTSIVLASGEKLTIKQDVYAALSKEREGEAFKWLEEHGFGGLIKSAVAVPFSREDFEKAVALAERLSEDGFEPQMQQAVHAQTLKAFLREQLEKGLPDLPLDLFGARPVWVAKISQPK